MKFFSTFSGIGTAEHAIYKHFPQAECVGFSEIEKNAIAVYNKNYPGHTNFGDILKIKKNELPDFDLLIGGSPCQDLSKQNNKRKGIIGGTKSSLFFEFAGIRKAKKPKYFILENVASMRESDKDWIDSFLGVKGVKIPSNKFTEQSRDRYYWFNFGDKEAIEAELASMPNMSKVSLFTGEDGQAQFYYAWSKSFRNKAKYGSDYYQERFRKDNAFHTLTATPSTGEAINLVATAEALIQSRQRVENKEELLSMMFKKEFSAGDDWYYDTKGIWFPKGTKVRRLRPNEAEMLQGLPKNWTDVSLDDNNKLTFDNRMKLLGNGMTSPVISYILSKIP